MINFYLYKNARQNKQITNQQNIFVNNYKFYLFYTVCLSKNILESKDVGIYCKYLTPDYNKSCRTVIYYDLYLLHNIHYFLSNL